MLRSDKPSSQFLGQPGRFPAAISDVADSRFRTAGAFDLFQNRSGPDSKAVSQNAQLVANRQKPNQSFFGALKNLTSFFEEGRQPKDTSVPNNNGSSSIADDHVSIDVIPVVF
jgi:hypothetical protein